MLNLRDYQQRMVDEAAKHRRVLMVAPTGSGKSVLIHHYAYTPNTLLLSHRAELIDQLAARMSDIPYSTLRAGGQYIPAPLVIASVQTATRRELPKFDQILIDETHHLHAPSWRSIIEKQPQARILGFTATPIRMDGQGLGGFFDKLVLGPSTAELIDSGFLSRYKIFAPSNVDTKGIPSRGGDFARNILEKVVDKPSITGCAVTEYQRRCAGKRAICFCVGVAHSQHVAEEFNRNGITAEHIDGNTTNRTDIIARFQRGDIQVLCNCDIIGEGLDIPGVHAVILLRPTKSLSCYLQQVGRALRPSEDKPEAIILDHAGNCSRHGFPDDDFGWSLEGQRTRRGRGASTSVRICMQCFLASKQAALRCPHCGTEFPVEQRAVAAVSGELVELQRAERKQRQGQCRTYEELVVEGKRRNMKFPERWAWYVMKGRRG